MLGDITVWTVIKRMQKGETLHFVTEEGAGHLWMEHVGKIPAHVHRQLRGEHLIDHDEVGLGGVPLNFKLTERGRTFV